MTTSTLCPGFLLPLPLPHCPYFVALQLGVRTMRLVCNCALGSQHPRDTSLKLKLNLERSPPLPESASILAAPSWAFMLWLQVAKDSSGSDLPALTPFGLQS